MFMYVMDIISIEMGSTNEYLCFVPEHFVTFDMWLKKWLWPVCDWSHNQLQPIKPTFFGQGPTYGISQDQKSWSGSGLSILGQKVGLNWTFEYYL